MRVEFSILAVGADLDKALGRRNPHSYQLVGKVPCWGEVPEANRETQAMEGGGPRQGGGAPVTRLSIFQGLKEFSPLY